MNMSQETYEETSPRNAGTKPEWLGRTAAIFAFVAAALMASYVLLSILQLNFFDWPVLLAIIVTVVGASLYMGKIRPPFPWLLLVAIAIVLIAPFLQGGGFGPWTIPGVGFVISLSDLASYGFDWFYIANFLFSTGYLLLCITFILALISFIKRDRTANTTARTHNPVDPAVFAPAIFTTDGTALAGWFPDPDGKPAERYWDGAQWTEQTRPQSFIAAAPGVVPAPGRLLVDASGSPVSPSSRLVALLLCLFLGGLGIHRFYVGKNGTGIAMIFTLGGLGIWSLVDLIMIAVGSFRDIKNRLLLNWQ